jgi:type II secretion system protein J
MDRSSPSSTSRGAGFTLIEVLLAMVAAAILLSALYGLFGRAVKLRDQAEEHIRVARLRTRAVNALKADLANARLLGTAMNGSFVGSQTPPSSSQFPGYLKFTTTTGRDSADAPYGDAQEVEYYITADPQSTNQQSGVLVRTTNRVLLASTPEITSEERLLTGVQSLELEFYDGSEWKSTWDTTTGSAVVSTSTSSTSTSSTASTTTATLPKAARIRVMPYSEQTQKLTPALEVVIPCPMEVPAK